MKISKKRRRALYAAIHGPITDLRIIANEEDRDLRDFEVAQLEQPIWSLVKSALGIDDE